MHRLLEFRERAVRDLAWVLLSPPMIECSVEGVSCATSAWCVEQFEEFLESLRELERDPSPLVRALEHDGYQKLGKYFENLIAFWLETSPRYDLLARNLQIRDAKKTYGELDLVVHDRQTGRTGHWEVAAKYYLELGPAEELSSWVGPNLRDNLARKSQHLLHHQARRCDLAVTQDLLANRGLSVDDSFVLLKGYLFHNLSPSHEAIQSTGRGAGILIHPRHRRAWWCTGSEFERTYGESELSWFELVKPNWFSNQSGIPAGDAMRSWTLADCTGPNLVVGMLGDQEVERGFVAPDDWGKGEAKPTIPNQV